jgi:hypothetical protein
MNNVYDEGCNDGCRGYGLAIDITSNLVVGNNTIELVCINAKGIGPCNVNISGNVATGYQAITTSSCPSGGVLDGSNCDVTYAASPSYYCPSGAGTLVGTQCMTSTGAIPAYSCPSPDTLSGTTCTHATTSAIPQPTVTVMDESTLNNCSPAEQYSK